MAEEDLSTERPTMSDLTAGMILNPANGARILMRQHRKVYPILLTMLFAMMLNTASAEPKTGLQTDVPIDAKLFKTTADYFKAKIPRKMRKAYKNNEVPASWNANGIPPDECIEYNPDEHAAMLYVPKSYDGTVPFGIYLHIAPAGRGTRPSGEWQALMDKLKLIYVSPHKTGNNTPTWRRMVLAMDSMATVKSHYKIDEKRVYVGGLSGGGHLAMLCQMVYPEYFQGAISHAAQSYLPNKRSFGHFPGLKLSDAKSPPRKKKNKWCVISGNKDGNYGRIKETSKEWERAKFQYKFFDIDGMGHHDAPVEALEEALLWMGAGKLPESKVASSAQAHESRTWTASSGKTIKATLVKHRAGQVTLKTDAGKLIKIAARKLSQDDRKYLRELGAKK